MSWLLAVLLIAFEIQLVRQAVAALPDDTAEDDTAETDTARHRAFADDIAQRASLGLPPDWPRYESALERAARATRRSLERLAEWVLVLGLGGSVLASLWPAGLPRSGISPSQLDVSFVPVVFLLTGIGALVAHAVIVRRLVPRAESLQSRSVRRSMEALEQVAAVHPPAETLLHRVERLPAFLGGFLDPSVPRALTRLPEAVEHLAGQISTLEETARRVDASDDRRTRSLEEACRLVTEVGEGLLPGVEALGRTVTRLQGLDEALADVLQAQRDHWSATLGEEHAERWRQLAALVQEAREAEQRRDGQLNRLIHQLAEVLTELPERLGHGIDGAAQDFGLNFGAQARSHVADLRQESESQRRILVELMAEHSRAWRRDVGRVVDEILEGGSAPVRDHLLPSLESVGRQLADGGAELKASVANLLAVHQEIRLIQDVALEETRRVAERLEGVAASLGDGDLALRRAVEQLDSRVAEMAS